MTSIPFCGLTGAWLLALFSVQILSAAALSQYTSRTWQSEDGLPQNSAQCITQTRDGYLWIGTQSGLARFDGIRFVRITDSDLPGVGGGSFRALQQTSDGSLWMGLEDGGLVQWKDGKVFHFTQKDGLPGSQVRVICETKDGSIWIGTNNGLVCYRNGKFSLLTEKEGLAHNMVRALLEDSAGTLWIGADNGLNYLTNGILKTFPLQNHLSRQSIRTLIADREDNLWVGLHGGLTKIESNDCKHFTREGSQSDQIVSAICADRRGNLWIGTYAGLNRFSDGQFFPELNHDGAPYDQVHFIFEDHEENIWVGTRSGLNRLTPRPYTMLTTRHGLTHDNVTSVCEDSSGNIWIGTWGGGLNRLRGETVTSFTKSNGLGSDFVLGLHCDPEGAVWIGTPYDNYSLKRWKEGKFTRFGNAEGLQGSGVRAIHADSNNVWVATGCCVNQFKDGKFTQLTKGGNAPKTIFKDRSGRLLLGTETGVTIFEAEKVSRAFEGSNVNSIYEDKTGTLWTALDVGLVRNYDFLYGTQQGLLDNAVYEILEDEQNHLWMSCSKGVLRVSKKDLDELAEKKRTSVTCGFFGLGNAECNQIARPSAIKTRDGRLLFATTKGLAVINPSTIKLNQKPPSVVIEEVIADKRQMSESMNQRVNESSTHSLTDSLIHNFTIPPGHGELEFHYTALSFQAPEKNRFKYKLDGLDADWVDADTRRVAFYNNIFPGTYIFRVVACNNDGVWNEVGASIKLQLLPHFWQTLWFKILLGFVGAGVLGFAYHVRVSRLRELEQLRYRIASDLHDDVGASLTKISMLTEIARREPVEISRSLSAVKEIAATNRHVIRSIQEIIWTIKPKNQTLDKLVSFMIRHAQDYFQDTGIRCRLDVPEELPERILPTDTCHNLFLVFKEALNNVAKHSKATLVSIQISAANNGFIVVINDNGQGFDSAKTCAAANGLANMKQRMQKMKGEFDIASTPEKGTCVSLRVFLK